MNYYPRSYASVIINRTVTSARDDSARAFVLEAREPLLHCTRKLLESGAQLPDLVCALEVRSREINVTVTVREVFLAFLKNTGGAQADDEQMALMASDLRSRGEHGWLFVIVHWAKGVTTFRFRMPGAITTGGDA